MHRKLQHLDSKTNQGFKAQNKSLPLILDQKMLITMKQALNLGGLPVADAGATETSGDRNKTNVQPLHFYYCIAFHHDEPDSRSMSPSRPRIHHPVKFLALSRISTILQTALLTSGLCTLCNGAHVTVYPGNMLSQPTRPV